MNICNKVWGTKLVQIGIFLNIEKSSNLNIQNGFTFPIWRSKTQVMTNVALLPIMRFKKKQLVLILKFS